MQIINRHTTSDIPRDAIYVGRGTPLGNPYEISKDDSREDVIAAYRHWINYKISISDPVVLAGLGALREDSTLICSCHPLPCHAEVIEEVWRDWSKTRCAHSRKFTYHDGLSHFDPSSGQIFVYGSTMGHNKAAAQMYAIAHLGAGESVQEWVTGSAYAIPWRNQRMSQENPLYVEAAVRRLREHIEVHSLCRLFFTEIAGAGLTPELAACLSDFPADRVTFPSSWRKHLEPMGYCAYAGIGSRQTPSDVQKKMTAAARRLEKLGWTLRSGGAEGADTAFELGAAEKKEIFLPWPGFNDNSSDRTSQSADALAVARAIHPRFDALSDAAKKMMARNTYQILGDDLKTPVRFVLCWTDDGATCERDRSKKSGGTGQAIALADRFGIPVFNMKSPDALNRLAIFLKEL